MSKKDKESTTVESVKLTGTIIFFLFKKGYGFIKPDNGGKDIFMHQTASPVANKSLKQGVKVSYTVGQVEHNTKGDVALNVEIIEE